MKEQDKFTQGFICAVACLLNSHGCVTEAKDVFKCNSYTEVELVEKGCDILDIETLKKHEIINNL